MWRGEGEDREREVGRWGWRSREIGVEKPGDGDGEVGEWGL